MSLAQTKPTAKRKPASTTTPLYIGHNLTPSTEVLKARTFTVGNYAAGFGLTENIFVATSPWIWYSYNTMNLHLKYSQDISARSTIGFFASYFDSYDSTNLVNSDLNSPGNTPFAAADTPTGANIAKSLNRYQWTSYSLHGLYSYHYEAGAVQYFNLKFSHFINDEMPYSLRMDPGNDEIRNQIDVSTLVKIPMRAGSSIALETGVLGLNYASPYAHLGASVAIQKQDWLVQLGASYTVPLAELGTTEGFNVGRMDNRVHYSEVARSYYTERYLQVAVHPEVQVQYSF